MKSPMNSNPHYTKISYKNFKPNLMNKKMKLQVNLKILKIFKILN